MLPMVKTLRESLLAALCADIAREAGAAADYLRLAGTVPRRRGAGLHHQAAECAAAAINNATALAAEVSALGGVPPVPAAPRRARQSPLRPLDEHLAEATAALTHYRGRLAMARRAGLVRLQEIFADIVRSKQRHLGHAHVLAATGATTPAHHIHRERFHAHRSTH